jgi:hypothetical protein
MEKTRVLGELIDNVLDNVGEDAGIQKLRETVRWVVSNMTPEEKAYYLYTESDNYRTGLRGEQAARLCPDYTDPTVMGDWEGYNLGNVQCLCQAILDDVREIL